VIYFFDTLYEWLAELMHLLVELSHQLFEVIEEGFDIAVEFIFETDVHTTQIIVFYILMAIFFYGVYKLVHKLPERIKRYRDAIHLYCLKEKFETIDYFEQLGTSVVKFWQDQDFIHKLQSISVLLLVFSGLIFWLFFL
jgi:hypothetical protein